MINEQSSAIVAQDVSFTIKTIMLHAPVDKVDRELTVFTIAFAELMIDLVIKNVRDEILMTVKINEFCSQFIKERFSK